MTYTSVGEFVWHDLMTTDVQSAIAFYGHVLGWTAAPFGDDYTTFSNQEGSLGGVTELPEDSRQAGARAHWSSHVQVANVDQTVAEVGKLGGRVYYGPADISDVGRFANTGDPDGTPINVFTPQRPMAGRNPKQHGAFVWHELIAADHERAFAFYRALFGWKKSSDYDMGAMGNYLLYNNGGADLGGMFTKPKDVPAPMWMHYIEVVDLGTALGRAKEGGAKVLAGPMEVPSGAHIVQLTDPQGAVFALHEGPAK